MATEHDQPGGAGGHPEILKHRFDQIDLPCGPGRQLEASRSKARRIKKGRTTKANGSASNEELDRIVAAMDLLTNHAHVLIVLHGNPDMVLREVAVRVGITERAVQRIIQSLEEGGYIRRQKVGRKNHYEVLDKQPLRHPIEAHRDIGDLLTLITQ